MDTFVAQLRAGEVQLEAHQDAALGRTRSLAASLSYGFARAFTSDQRAGLAVLHLFQDTVDLDALRNMGDADTCGEDAVPELAGLDRDTGIALLDRAAGIGLLTSLGSGSGYYQIHPALPWYFTALFTTTYGQPSEPAARRASRAYAKVMGEMGDYYFQQASSGYTTQTVAVLQAEEANLSNAMDRARGFELWDAAIGCMQGLQVLYHRTGRDSEWARLVTKIAPEFTDPITGGPLPGREEHWNVITSYRARLAWNARDWPTAIALREGLAAWSRDQAATVPTSPSVSLTPAQHLKLRNLAISLGELGNTLRQQNDPGCLPHLQEALTLQQRIGNRQGEAHAAGRLGNAYLVLPELRDLDQAEHWFRRSLSLRPNTDRLGRAMSLNSLGNVALERFDNALAVGGAEPVLLDHLNAALRSYQQALDLTPVGDHAQRSLTENQLGNIYAKAGDISQALRHYQQAIQHAEARRDIHGAGQTRENIAILLVKDGRIRDALHYARAAQDNFLQAGPGGANDADGARQLIAQLEQLNGENASRSN